MFVFLALTDVQECNPIALPTSVIDVFHIDDDAVWRNTMSIQDLGALGELIGAIASVVLLIYIAVQIRQNSKMLEHNTRATETSTRQAFASQDQAYLCSSLDGVVLAVAVAKLENDDDLSALEVSQLIARQHVNFWVFESAYSQYSRGVLTESEWERYRKIIAFLMERDRPAQQMWMGLKEVFSTDFVAEVDRLGGEDLQSEEPVIASGTSVYVGESAPETR